MAQIHLTILTPGKCLFDGPADRVMVRTTGGDVSILPGHIDYAAALGNGKAKVTAGGNAKNANINGGMLYAAKDEVRIFTNSFEWE